MQRKHVYSTLVPDTLAMIAACTNSRPMMELAVALRAVVSGVVLLPPDRLETISRITRDLTNRQWNLKAHITLRDPIVGYWAKMFGRACIQAVPLTAENPTRDLVWQGRVKAELERNSSLQNHAKLLLQRITLRVTPALPVVAPVVATNATTAPAGDNAAVHTLAKEAPKPHAHETRFATPPEFGPPVSLPPIVYRENSGPIFQQSVRNAQAMAPSGIGPPS